MNQVEICNVCKALLFDEFNFDKIYWHHSVTFFYGKEEFDSVKKCIHNIGTYTFENYYNIIYKRTYAKEYIVYYLISKKEYSEESMKSLILLL